MKENSPRLGRGLAALFGDGSANGFSQDIAVTLKIETLAPGPFQPRGPIEPASLEELASSIRRQGVLQPILVRPHPTKPAMHEIIAGERRWRAAQVAGLIEIPVLIRSLSDLDAQAAALIENLQRQDLNAIEEAEGYSRLIKDHSISHEQLGGMIGKSRSHIANTIRLLQLSSSVRGLVSRGELTAGHARALLNHPDQVSAANAIISQGLNVRQTEAMLKNIVPAGTIRNTVNPEFLSLERELTEFLGLSVRIRQNGEHGSVNVAFRNLDQLDGIIRLLRPL